MLDDLRLTLQQNIGAELTPELCARLMASAAWYGTGGDVAMSRSGRMIEVRSAGRMAQVRDVLGPTFSLASGHRFLMQLDHQGEPAIVVGFTRIQPGVRAEVSIWARRDRGCMGRDFIRCVFRFAFDTLKLGCLMALVNEGNHKSIATVLALGFRPTGQIPSWFSPTEGADVFTMLPDECRWLIT